MNAGEAADLEELPPVELAEGPTWDLSCPDWVERLKGGRSLVPELPLFKAEADRAVEIFGRLRLADVPGTPQLSEAAGPWFVDIVRALFGSFDPVLQMRMIREVFNLVPKKNSKTSYGALLMLTALLMNRRPKADFLMTAPVLETADMAFDQAAGAISLDPVLVKLFHVKAHLKTIVHRNTGAELQIVTFDPSVLTGRKVSGGALIDELHIVSQQGQKASKSIRQLRGGMMPFPEAFLVFITTQGEDPPAGAMDAELQAARDVRDGKVRGRMLPVLYELPMELQAIPEDGRPAPWLNPRLWPMVTPNLGRSISIQALREGLAKAKQTGEAEVRGWASQHLNIQVGVGLHARSWAAAPYWQAAGVDYLSGGKDGLAKLLELSEVVVAGIDGGGLDDLLALVVVGRHAKTKDWLVWAHAWCHRGVLKLRQTEAEKLLGFESDGDLTIVDHSGPDVEELGDYIEQCEQTGLLDRVGVDQAGITDVADELELRKIARERVVGIPQGWKMVGVIKTTERNIHSRKIKHGRQRLMAYAMGNAKTEPRGNAVIITKETAGKAKIDPLLAMLDACTLMGLDPKPRKKLYQMLII